MKFKRYRKPIAKPGELLVKFGQEYGDKDLFYCWPENESHMKGDSKILMHAFEGVDIFGKTMREHLIERGYDITTLNFSIKKLPESVD